MIYIVKGLARIHDDYAGEARWLNGIACQDDFAEFLDEASEMGILSGYMSFESKNGELYTITTYLCDRELTKAEQEFLMNYTQGQWSDGIGEGFEQDPVYDEYGNEAYISPWFRGQDISISAV